MSPQGRKIERAVREKLSRELGMSLKNRKLVLGRNSDGEEIKKEFDLVSPDEALVGEIKSYKFANKTTGKAGYNTTRKARLLAACFYLEKVNARTKLLILTNKKLYDVFMSSEGCLIHKSIEIKYLATR